jgi:hypothetical protein
VKKYTFILEWEYFSQLSLKSGRTKSLLPVSVLSALAVDPRLSLCANLH